MEDSQDPYATDTIPAAQPSLGECPEHLDIHKKCQGLQGEVDRLNFENIELNREVGELRDSLAQLQLRGESEEETEKDSGLSKEAGMKRLARLCEKKADGSL